ncbi:DUF2894 domain-containing protein [Achromobacter mucicolens]|uniref:DUF2894 domain-containing protein n=1 Tax=Achromobacter mucicolens TaxID=1389922 RepID=UPI000D3D6E77|nr:DUF2894 domain-containing protein [Achromobacter mucicolens]PTW98972.1 DUF2894 domain-containing protein [Achromobacter mucicolens]
MSSDGNREAVLDARAVLDGWRASGADRADPLLFHLIDALARRAASYVGPARLRLDARLADLIQAYESALTNVGAAEEVSAEPPARKPGPLAGLVAYLDNPAAARPPQASDAEPDSADADRLNPLDARDPLGLRAAYPELPLLDEFQTLWSRFSADRQVRQSQEQVHKNAGPLNSNQLVHRALSLMREMSPGYLQQFLSYTDALMWMEQMTASAAPAPKEAPRAGAAKKSTRSKPRKQAKESKESA